MMTPVQSTWTAEHMGQGRKVGDKRKSGGGRGAQGVASTLQSSLLLRVGVRDPSQKEGCWVGEHKAEGVGRMGTSKPTDTPSPPQVRSLTTAPGKAVAGNLPAPTS